MKNKKQSYENYNPIEFWIWQNKKHFGQMLKLKCLTPYGSKNLKWRYDFKTGEFIWNQFKMIDKSKWSKESVEKRILAKKFLRADYENPMWTGFQKALLEFEKQK